MEWWVASNQLEGGVRSGRDSPFRSPQVQDATTIAAAEGQKRMSRPLKSQLMVL